MENVELHDPPSRGGSLAPLANENDILSQLDCPVCLRDVVNKPVETTCCNKLVCEGCEKRHRAGQGEFAKCFNCRRGIYRVQENFFLRKYIESVRVRCTLCSKAMTHKEFEAHVSENFVLQGDGACPQLKRSCPNAGRGCEFEGLLADLKNHIAETCTHGLREFDQEAKRLCGGEERIRHNVELIKSVLSIGGGSGAVCPPERPKLFQERLQAARVYITVAEYQRLVGTTKDRVSPGTKLAALREKKLAPDADPTVMQKLVDVYAVILRHRVVDTWNFTAAQSPPSPADMRKRGVQRPSSENSGIFPMSDWYSLFYEDLPREIPPPPPTPPPPPPRDNRPWCRFYRKSSSCRLGRNCRFRHY